MSLLDRIYNQSPVWLQNVMCSTKGYIIGQRRYGKLFYKVLNEYETKSISTEQKLIELLEVSKYVAAYRDYITPKLLTKVKRGGN